VFYCSRHADVIRGAAEHLSDGGIAPDTLSRLLRCVDAIGDRRILRWIGVMPPHRSDATRLYVDPRDREGLSDYLRRIEYPGQRERIESLYCSLLAHCDFVNVQFAVREGVLPQCAFECKLAEVNHERWTPLLEYLASRSLCSASRMKLVHAWCGMTAGAAHHRRRIERRVSHVKVSMDSAAKLSAKAYLGAIF
jgi:hypothetical protein